MGEKDFAHPLVLNKYGLKHPTGPTRSSLASPTGIVVWILSYHDAFILGHWSIDGHQSRDHMYYIFFSLAISDHNIDMLMVPFLSLLYNLCYTYYYTYQIIFAPQWMYL